MEFTVSKSALVGELKLLQGVVETKSTIPVLSNVLIEAVKDRIVLTGTDLEVGIRCSCPAKVKKQGSTTIPSKKLRDYVALLPDSDIHIKVGENHWASLVCGRSKAKMLGMSRESFPSLPEQSAVLAEIPAGVLTSLIGRTEFAISHEESRYTLNGSLLILKLGQLVMVATDGHRLAYTDAAAEISGEERVVIPKKALVQLQRLLAEEKDPPPVQFSRANNHLFFELRDRLLVVTELSGNFPDYSRVLPKEEQPHSLLIDREALRSAIERVAQFADERAHAIRLQVRPGEVTLQSSSVENGEAEEDVPAEYSGPPLEIGLNAAYLLDFLKAIPDNQVNLLLKDAQGALEMRPAGGKADYRYIAMPLRV